MEGRRAWIRMLMARMCFRFTVGFICPGIGVSGYSRFCGVWVNEFAGRSFWLRNDTYLQVFYCIFGMLDRVRGYGWRHGGTLQRDDFFLFSSSYHEK